MGAPLLVGLAGTAVLAVLCHALARGVPRPETPERVLLFKQHLIGIGLGAGLVLRYFELSELVPLAIVAVLSAWFVVRRRLFPERRGLAGYLVGVARFLLAFFAGYLL